jgi:carbamate kinase
MTNIAEHIARYGDPQPPRAPSFGVIDADTAGELVAEGIATGKFLILTTDAAAAELRERGNDIDAYLQRVINS